MYCEHCGTKLDNDAKFCTSCGTSTSEQAVAAKPVDIIKQTPSAELNITEEINSDSSDNNFKADFSYNIPSDIPAEPSVADSSAAIDSSPNNFSESEEFNVEVIEEVKVGGGRKFAAVLLVPFILVFLLIFNFTASLRFSLSGDNIKKAYNNMNFAELLTTQLNSDTTLLSCLYDLVDDGIKEKYDIKKKNVQRFIEKSNVQAYSSNIVAQYADLIILGKGGASLTSDDIVDFIKDNKKYVKEEFGYNLTNSDYKEIERIFNDTKETKFLSPSNWKKFGLNFRYTYIYIYIILAVSLIFTIVFMIWQSVILSKKSALVTRFLGFSLIVGGLITLLPIIPIITLSNAATVPVFLAANLLSVTVKFLGIFGGGELLIGIILSIAGKKLRRKALK